MSLFNQEVQGFWVNLKEDDKEIQYLTYQAFILTPKKGPEELQELVKKVSIGVNTVQTCLNLRSKKDISSEIIKCVSSNRLEQSGHTHLKILETSGDWTKVEVTDYVYNNENDDSGEGCSFRQKKKITGWIKAVDESGFPNIWYSITAY